MILLTRQNIHQHRIGRRPIDNGSCGSMGTLVGTIDERSRPVWYGQCGMHTQHLMEST